MPEEITINNDLQIIEVMSVGDITINDLESSMATVKKINSETGFTKILVDTTREKSFPDTFKVHTFASLMPRGMQFALVSNEGQPTKKHVRYVETVAINRGLLVQEFNSKSAALEWLTD